MIKTSCIICNKEIIMGGVPKRLRKTCSHRCSAEYQKQYLKSDKYKQYQKQCRKQYRKSDKYKQYQKQYQKSDKYKQYKKQYRKQTNELKKQLKQKIFQEKIQAPEEKK